MLYLTGMNVDKVKPEDKVLAVKGEHPKYLVKMTGVVKSIDTLQEKEMEILTTPKQFGSGGKKATLVQGPSLIGVHTNNEEDGDVLEFSK